MTEQNTTNANLAIWDQVEKTNPDFTKEFNSGGMKGTSINATYLARKATEVFGPYGIGWGVEIIEEEYKNGGPLLVPNPSDQKGPKISATEVHGVPVVSVIHILRIKLWYISGDTRGEVTHYGQTTFVGANKYGIYTDEEAPKKSLTDATTKALSMLGFGGDIFMGLFDDASYRQEIQQDFGFEKEEEREAEAIKRHEEFVAFRDRWLEKLSTAVNQNELGVNYAQGVKTVERHVQKTRKPQNELLEKAKEIYLNRKNELQAKAQENNHSKEK